MFLFCHIEKCGGTTINQSLGLSFRRYIHVTKNFTGGNHEINNLTEDQFKKLLAFYPQGIGGHSVRPYLDFKHEKFKSAQWVTFLRDPLERALSFYFYSHRLIKEGRNYRAGKKFEMTNDIDQFLRNFHSGIKYFFPKAISLESIDTFVNDYFVHIGVMDHYQKSMDILAEKLDKPKVKISHKNISKRTQYPSEGSIRKYKENNKFEYALYEKALKLNNF